MHRHSAACQRVRAKRGPMTGSARPRNFEIPGSAPLGCPGMTGPNSMRAWLMAMMVALASSSASVESSLGSQRRGLRILHKRRKRLRMIWMPARQCGTIFNDVAGGPENPPLVQASRHVVIGAQNVEVAGVQPFDHEVDGLLRRPGPGRLLGAALGSKPGEYKTRNHQVRADPAAGRVSQLVLQRLGEGFDACLGNIIRGVARR